MSVPRASVVLRKLADAAIAPYNPQTMYSQNTQYGSMQGRTMSSEQAVAESIARTCAYSFSASLRAVADEFEKAEAVPADGAHPSVLESLGSQKTAPDLDALISRLHCSGAWAYTVQAAEELTRLKTLAQAAAWTRPETQR